MPASIPSSSQPRATPQPPPQAPVYAVSKGVALAGVSAFAQLVVPGVAFNALLLTVCTAGSLLFALRTNMIKVRGRCSRR